MTPEEVASPRRQIRINPAGIAETIYFKGKFHVRFPKCPTESHPQLPSKQGMWSQAPHAQSLSQKAVKGQWAYVMQAVSEDSPWWS